MTRPTGTSDRTKVCLICPGLGRIARGYETFTRETFDALRRDDRLEVHLFKGGGPPAPNEQAFWNLHRKKFLARVLGKLILHNSYYVEGITFFVSLIPQLSRLQPDIIFYSDVSLREPLYWWRRISGQKYRLLLCNGGPVGPPFPHCDHVHQSLPGATEQAVSVGYPAERQTFVPQGFDIPASLPPISMADRADLRARLGLPANRPVLLSVGAVNDYHKRMDYVIREVASLPTPRPYLLLLGNLERESPPILRLGNELLGPDGFLAKTVPGPEVSSYYRAADLFVLASTNEGFGRVYVEALSHGLPCLAHDYTAARYTLGNHGLFSDFRTKGGLSDLIRGYRLDGENEAKREIRHKDALDRFGWDRLRNDYVEMLRHCAATSPEIRQSSRQPQQIKPRRKTELVPQPTGSFV